MQREYQLLDILRVWATTEIVFYHSRIHGLYHTNAYLFADFFFIMSGFILTRIQLPRNLSLKQFALKRLLRLYPLHLCAMLYLVFHFGLLVGKFPEYADGTWYAFGIYVLFIQALSFRNQSDGDWNYPAWAISAEFWGNLLFFLRPLKESILANLVLGITCYGLIYRFENNLDTFSYDYFGYINSGLLRALGGMALGAVVSLLPDGQRLKTSYIFTALELLVLVTVILALIPFGSAPLLALSDFMLIPLFAMMVWVFSLESGHISTVLKKTKLQQLAPYTFAAYIFHRPVLMYLYDVWQTSQEYLLPAYIAVVSISAFMAKTYIEDPGMTFFQRFISKNKLRNRE